MGCGFNNCCKMSSKHIDTRTKARCTRPPILSHAPSTAREALAVVLMCGGVMTILALGSFHPRDISLNASGGSEVHNLIGPAGALWADLLLQGLGFGAFALAASMLLASWRAFFGRRVTPGLREGLGIALLVVFSGALASLLAAGGERAFPMGGVVGALLAQSLRERFATVGAIILAGGGVLLAATLTTDGVLWGLGWRGLGVARGLYAVLGAGAAQLRPWTRRMLGFVRRSRTWPSLRLTHRFDLPVRPGRLPGQNAGASRNHKPLAAVADLARQGTSPAAGAPAPPVVHARKPAAQADLCTPAEGSRMGENDDATRGASSIPFATATRTHAGQSASGPKLSQEPAIVDVRRDLAPCAMEGAIAAAKPVASRTFELPPVSLLPFLASVRAPVDPAVLRDKAILLTDTLKQYGIDGHVREIRPGPVVTMYEYVPGPGIKLSKIASLADDIAMKLEALRVRIVAPIPGKGAVGIEIPNDTRETVYLREIIANDAFRDASSPLTMALGKDIEGNAYVADLSRMPHLLVAGATGAGKSVSVNAMIMSILFKATPEEVRMIMVDPKMLELSVYDGIPHLLLPVVTDPKKAALALRWAVEEMERRYELLSEVGVRSIDGYNAKVKAATECGKPVLVAARDGAEGEQVCAPLPYLMVIVDELADLMMVASREVEISIMRLAQMARAAGIHLILATQRPSVDVLTGVIKANFPTRIAFQVASRHDSRTIIDSNGAEHLLGRGDMLYLSPGAGGLTRVHGAYVADEEIERTVAFVRAQGTPNYDESILQPRGDEGDGTEAAVVHDEMYDQAVSIVAETRQASISMIQRRLRIGYNRAARMVEQMETEGIVGPADGAKPRDVLVSAL